MPQDRDAKTLTALVFSPSLSQAAGTTGETTANDSDGLTTKDSYEMQEMAEIGKDTGLVPTLLS